MTLPGRCSMLAAMVFARWLVVLACVLLLATPGAAAQIAEPAPPPEEQTPQEVPSAPSLVDRLRMGGFVIYIRHTTTDQRMPDSDLVNLDNCATQRNLTDVGRAQAVAMGEAFRSLGIPVGEVLSSEYCRTRETATLAFGRVTPTNDLSSIAALDPTELARRLDALRLMLTTPPESGANTVLVSHQFNLQSAMNVSLGTEGEAAIYEPAADGTTTLIIRLLPHQWAELGP